MDQINQQSLAEFQSKQSSLTTGYLILIDNQVLHFASKKDWEKEKETYPVRKQRFLATDLELWHQLLSIREEKKKLLLNQTSNQ